MEKSSVYAESEQEALRFKWIESEKAGRDLGEVALRRWVQQHWWGYLRARWLEHLHGKRFWVELDRGDFGLLQRRFQDKALSSTASSTASKPDKKTSTSSSGPRSGASPWGPSLRSWKPSTSTAAASPTASTPRPASLFLAPPSS